MKAERRKFLRLATGCCRAPGRLPRRESASLSGAASAHHRRPGGGGRPARTQGGSGSTSIVNGKNF
jgi:hypothetical protein